MRDNNREIKRFPWVPEVGASQWGNAVVVEGAKILYGVAPYGTTKFFYGRSWYRVIDSRSKTAYGTIKPHKLP
jgi:hypothetical protein